MTASSLRKFQESLLGKDLVESMEKSALERRDAMRQQGGDQTATEKRADNVERITIKQMSYLIDLIDRDPGEASNVGLTKSNVNGLSKARASQLIEILR